ncbi:hypothetical protein GCM10027449_27830 [Sinomonas notoginsengisoli]|uniref:ADP-ribosylglycohydrolase family protein n=1 Tax=Sinomonas notoginsengisoli TaxID=1457311 RepID=UPI001F168EEA|nr:ADP-ribosylglycohydrolase family protein [Sinomonas notoginsengisoli]
MSSPSPASRIQGCLVGTAVAESAVLAGLSAEGAGNEGTLRPLGAAGQLTLFTADALLEAIEWANSGVHADEAACVWLASLRWVSAQGVPISPTAPVGQPRWLDTQDGVLVPVASAPAWTSSLTGGEMGSPSRPVGLEFDDAGAAAHAAPFGLVPHITAAAVAKMSVDGASLTHGAAVAVQAAAAVACVVHFLTLGADLRTAAESARAQIGSFRSPEAGISEALEPVPEPEADFSGDRRGAGRTLAGAVSAVLAAESAAEAGDAPQAAFVGGVQLAAAHGPDAAAIAGALLGTRWGREAVPSRWVSATAGMKAAAGLAARLAEAAGA